MDEQRSLPKALYRADQVRELDRIAIEDCGIPGFRLMQQAGAVALAALLDRWPQTRHVLVFTGGGNNGGDGYVLAALARDRGLNPEIVYLAPADRLAGDAQLAWQMADTSQVPLAAFDREVILGTGTYPPAHTVIVDALLGTGLDRPVSSAYAEAIETINELPFPVLAVDIPSGLCSDTGAVLGTAVNADLTVTFIGMKQGMVTANGPDQCGDIIFHNLDVPDSIYHQANSPSPAAVRIDMNQMSRLLKPRRLGAHKGDFGHTLVIGGDLGYGGAVLMAAEAALRAGSGLVSVVTRSCHRSGILARRPEIMVYGTEDSEASEDRLTALLSKATVAVTGPGLGRSQWSRQLFQRALQMQLSHNLPLVVDADALNLLAERTGNAPVVRDNWVLTPHPGEAGRLLDCQADDIQADRFTATRTLQRSWGGVCLLKGAGSVICISDGASQHLYICSEGNPGMATGGMGDVLSGIIGALVAQGFSLGDSLRIAVCIHGESADLAAAIAGQRGLAASDLSPYIQQLANPDGY